MFKITLNYTRHVTLFLVSLTGMSLSAQQQFNSDRTPLYKSINLNYIIGAQMYNDNFLYNPGYSMDLAIGKELDEHLSLGLGMAFTNLKSKIFIPTYFEVCGKKKNKSNTPFIKIQSGYSFAWDNNTNNMLNYDFKGGLYFNAGIGRIIKSHDNYSILFHCSYNHQFAKMQYQVFGEKNYSETLSFDMIKISLGILFN